MPVSDQLPHLIVEKRFSTEKYTYAGPIPMGEVQLPVRDRASHGASLRQQLDQARQQNEQMRGVTTTAERPARIVLEVRSEPDFELALDGLEPRSQGVELACVRNEDNQRVAVIHVPEGKLSYFVKRVEQYVAEQVKSGKPKNQDLIDRIAEIRLATLRSFWTDEGHDFPQDDRPVWWEVWLRSESDQGPWETFRMLAQAAGLRVGTETIRFPDRLVGLCSGTATQLSSSADILDLLGEIRRAKENPAGFLALTPREQAEWVEDLRQRITPPPADAPAVCVLDHGVVINPLLQPALAPEDCLKYDPSWPLTDAESHGTEMSGVALFGDQLSDLLLTSDAVTLAHRLESVKIVPPPPRQNEPRLYGAITAQAAYRIESQRPTRRRAFCLAITTDGTDRGKPTSWSGEIDQLCAGVGDGNRRLVFISAGNAASEHRCRYPDSNDTDAIQDPAQAWNAITVGACTSRWQFPQQQFPGYQPLGKPGDLSPSSTTSLAWFQDWPFKPDIVLEGGNFVIHRETHQVMDPDEMAILTTAHAAAGRLLVPFRDTSAATAQAARMAAILHSQYPRLWPETIRALLIHSAEWTPAMRDAFDAKTPRMSPKDKCRARLRRYGYGVASLIRALYSARNSLTLIAQQTLRPFDKEGSEVKTKEMGIHALPWPQQQLLELGDATVEMRVTLSYFIEPKPGRRGAFARTRHRYQSHGLRFDVCRPQESLDEFRQRINKAARDEDEEYGGAVGDTTGWVLGPNLRTRGSIHSDWWQGIAADLAACGYIAVYPVTGWWREKTDQDYWARHARYSLVVSIRTEATTIDLYTPVSTMVAVPTPVEVEVETE